MKDKKKQRKILIIALAVILTLSVGYAIFSESLNISGSASTGSTNFNIVFDRVGAIREVETSSTTAEIKESGKKLEINVPGLSMPTAYAIIPVTIKNKGEITAKVKDIRTEGLDTTDIKVTYEGLAKEDIFNPNDEKEVNIKVVWDSSSTSTSVEASFSIEIVYEQVASGSITTTSAQTITDSRFIYEGTKLMGLSAEGEEYFKQPENKELIIPEGTTEIADGAFMVPYGYEGEVPDFELFGSFIASCGLNFGECTEEQKNKFDSLNDKFNLLFDYNSKNNRLEGLTMTIPSSVRKIGGGAFAGLELTGNLLIPDSVVQIGSNAFTANKFTGNLIIPDSVEKIGIYAFAANQFNGELKLSAKLKIIEDLVFYANKFTGNLIIPDGVIEVGVMAFASNNFNGNLNLASTLKKIEIYGFYYNQFSGDLTIPDNVEEISMYSFAGSGFTGTLTLSNNLTKIVKGTFLGTGFTGELYIPDSVSNIDYDAFWECNNLTSVSMPSSTTYKEVASGLDNPSFPSEIPINKR